MAVWENEAGKGLRGLVEAYGIFSCGMWNLVL